MFKQNQAVACHAKSKQGKNIFVDHTQPCIELILLIDLQQVNVGEMAVVMQIQKCKGKYWRCPKIKF